MNENEQERITRVPLRSGNGPPLLAEIVLCNNKVFTPT